MLSSAQVAFFFGYTWTTLLWLLSEYLSWKNRPQEKPYDDGEQELLLGTKSKEDAATQKGTGQKGDADKPEQFAITVVADGVKADTHDAPAKPPPGSPVAHAPVKNQSLWQDAITSPLVKCMTLDLNAIQAANTTLRAMFEFGTLMVWYYLCDRTDVFLSGDKSYSRDLFVFLFVILTAVAIGSSLQTVKQQALLVRQQTEEWKGWMQVLFLLYHYFEAREAYNAIRLFIAAYVWMTGFGNFLYYYKTSDFSIGRFAQMMWRLNFLVFFACVVLQNSYMLYYICPMHTLFTIFVYAALGIGYQVNKSKAWLAIKVVVCWLSIIVLWHKSVFYATWSPFLGLMGYQDPRKPRDDLMHEWYFRSGLDRYIWIYGMVCAMVHPYAQQWLNTLDTLPKFKQMTIRSIVLSICCVVGYIWYVHVYTLPKEEYNQVHPYTSWIPITLWCVVRNIGPTLRLHHLRLYGWLGCITLETYICQFHIWMKTGIPDGQPKSLLVLIPGYPLLNFTLVSAGYVFISHRLFELTNTLKNAAVPHSNNQLLLRNTLLMAATGAGVYAVGTVGRAMFSVADQ